MFATQPLVDQKLYSVIGYLCLRSSVDMFYHHGILKFPRSTFGLLQDKAREDVHGRCHGVSFEPQEIGKVQKRSHVPHDWRNEVVDRRRLVRGEPHRVANNSPLVDGGRKQQAGSHSELGEGTW